MPLLPGLQVRYLCLALDSRDVRVFEVLVAQLSQRTAEPTLSPEQVADPVPAAYRPVPDLIVPVHGH